MPQGGFYKLKIHMGILLIWHCHLLTVHLYIDRHYQDEYVSKDGFADDDKVNRDRSGFFRFLYGRLSKRLLEHSNVVDIRVVTAERNQDYLIQVVTSVLAAYHGNDSRIYPRIELCNVESYLFDELRQFEGTLPIRSINAPTTDLMNTKSSLHDQIFMKEAMDYWKCLNISTESRYVLLLEDDAVVIPMFATLLTSLIEKLDKQTHIDYVKLFHPNSLRGIPSIPMAVAVCFMICAACQMFVFRRILVLWLVLTSSAMYLVLRSYGSQFLADIRYHLTGSIYLTFSESCCTQAVLFRSSKIPEIAYQLSLEARHTARAGHAKDHILDESKFLGRQTDKNFVLHIGHISLVHGMHINQKQS